MKRDAVFKIAFMAVLVFSLNACDSFFGGGCVSDPYETQERFDEPCVGLPENAFWNTAEKIDQVFNGEWFGWTPSEIGRYNEEPSTTECRFKCKKGFEYSGSVCTDENLSGVWSDTSRHYEQMSFNSALDHCESLEERGFTDWRLPSISELRTLIRNCDSTKSGGDCKVTEYCPDIFCFDDPCHGCEEGGEYSKIDTLWTLWSATPVDNYFVWAVDFTTGGLGKRGVLDEDHNTVDYADVICIRTEPGTERTVSCEDLPEHGIWNSANRIIQKWDGIQWIPTAAGSYNEEQSEKECRFICEEGYVFNEAGLCILEKTDEKWSLLSTSPMSWEDASLYCDTLDEGGFSEWRMPTISELMGIIINCPFIDDFCGVRNDEEDHSNSLACDGCQANSNILYSLFGDVEAIWSSTTSTDHEDLNKAWTVNFKYASVDMFEKDETGVFVRCIKDLINVVPGRMITKKCKGLPHNAVWNDVDEIVQIWDGKGWVPSEQGVYNETGSDTECRFYCAGMFWNGSECMPSSVKGKWSSRSEKPLLWNESVKFCDDLVERDHSDWRLPSISELRTLVINCKPSITGGECGVTDECLTASCSTGCQGCEENSEGYSVIGEIDTLWSVSSVADETEKVWSLRFYDGRIIGSDQNTEVNFARCVR